MSTVEENTCNKGPMPSHCFHIRHTSQVIYILTTISKCIKESCYWPMPSAGAWKRPSHTHQACGCPRVTNQFVCSVFDTLLTWPANQTFAKEQRHKRRGKHCAFTKCCQINICDWLPLFKLKCFKKNLDWSSGNFSLIQVHSNSNVTLAGIHRLSTSWQKSKSGSKWPTEMYDDSAFMGSFDTVNAVSSKWPQSWLSVIMPACNRDG